MAGTGAPAQARALLPLGGVVGSLFHHREELFAALRTGAAARALALRMTAYVVLFAAVYGLVIGIYAGAWQVVYDLVKLPWVLLATLALSAACLYVLNAFAGARMSWAQTIAVVLTGLLATVTVLLALLPVVAFIMFSGERDYYFTVFTNVVAFAIAGWCGARFAIEATAAMHEDEHTRGRCVAVMRGWMAVYGLVGLQMAWLLRPYFRQTEVFIRPLGEGGTVFEALARLLWKVLVTGSFQL
jgi:hypothetical protein